MTFREFVQDRWVEIYNSTVGHLRVVALSVIIAAVLGMAIGMVTYRSPKASASAVSVTVAFFTIPSLALLGLLIGPLGLGIKPTIVALVIYALLPIVRNTVVALRGIDPAVVESARGIGMGTARRMLLIELPLAWPVILAGIRVSTQATTGIATIAAYVGGPGLGNLIFGGLNNFGGANAVNSALAGTLGVAVLALLLDALLLGIGRVTTSRGLYA